MESQLTELLPDSREESLLHGPEIKFASHFGASVIIDLAWPPLEVCSHLLFTSSLARQVAFTGRLWLRVPPGVIKHTARSNTLLGIERQSLHKEVNTIAANDAETHLEVLSTFEGVTFHNCVLGQLGDAGPVAFCRGTDVLADQPDLINLRIARQVRSSENEFGKDGSNRPDVNGARVVLHAKEQLRWAVPSGNDVRGHVDVRIGEGPGKTEIS